MIPALIQYPRFEKGSPSTEYQQIINFCVNYLEGMLVGLIHMEIPEELAQHSETLKALQNSLLSRERTIRHAFQFQIEKYFADFKSVSRTRIKVNYASHQIKSIFTDHKTSRIQDLIESISKTHQISHQTQLQNTLRRIKTLVHRLDDNNDGNPISPLFICQAFLASIEPLNLSNQKNRYLFELFDITLKNQLGNFYNQIDLGLYYLDILADLTAPSLFSQPEVEIEKKQQDTDNPLVSPNNLASKGIQSEKAETNNIAITSIQNHFEQAENKSVEIDTILNDFKESTENGTMEYTSFFVQVSKLLYPLVNKKQRGDIDKFVHFYTSLLNNTLLSIPLKTQLSRLSNPLLQMVMIDPFFFRSSNHPVNDFIQSVVDFELRYKHQGNSLAILSQLISKLLDMKKVSLSDYQLIIESYEDFKNPEIERLEQIKQEKTRQKAAQKEEVLQLVNKITESLVVDQETMQFFYDDWQLLFLHLIKKHGNNSTEYNQSIDVAKILSWFLDENKTGSHPEFEQISFKSLLTSIEEGLVEVNFSSEHRHRVRKQLVKEYRQANQNQAFSIIPKSPFRKISGKLSHSHNPVPVHNIINTENASQDAKNLNIGDWVEIKESTDSNFNRAKLKWKAPDSSLFIFIDQRGHKIKECDLIQLFQDFSCGNIKLLKKTFSHLNVYF